MSSPGKTHDLPLLDEVTNLLDKERTLMGLKVLEQQVEAQEWKRKYEALVGQVAQSGAETDNVRVFEIAADITAKPVPIANFRMKIMQTIRSNGVNWVADLSNIEVGNEGIVEVLKIFHGMRDSCRVTVILLRNSQLDSSCNEHMAAVISFPYFEGIDASWNNLTRPFYDSMLKALEVRRRAPQYLILNNNPDLANISLIKMLQILSQETWGIVVTVKDATGMPIDSNHKSKTGMYAADFLKVLNTQLVGNKKKIGKASSSALVGKQKSGIQLLTALGLVNSTLSRISLKLLEETLDLATATLTDLDLSFSFIGYRGMDMIKNAMSSPGRSQIVRLGLKGNAFTNSMISLLGEVVEHSTTLTYLDISNNLITGDGLLDLTRMIKNNFILSTLCLTGNPIGQSSATLAQGTLTKSGCPVRIRWNGILSPVGIPLSHSNLAKKKSFIFSRLKRSTALVQPAGQDAVLYSIPVGCIQVKRSIHYSTDSTSVPGVSTTTPVMPKKMLVEWNMRPRFEDSTRLADLDRINHRRQVNTVILPMEWEIFLVTPQGRSSLAKQILGGGAGLPPGDNWVQCRAVVDAVPTHGHLEVVVRAAKSSSLHDQSEYPAYIAQAELLLRSIPFRTSTAATPPAVRVDTYGLTFSAYDDLSSDCATFGEDVHAWSGTLNQLVSMRTAALVTLPSFNPAYEVSHSISSMRTVGTMMKAIAGFPPPGHSVLRLFQWPGPMTPTATIEFETKLSSGGHTSTRGLEADWDIPGTSGGNTAAQMSYECAVHLCFAHGQFETVGSSTLLPSGKCVGSECFFIQEYLSPDGIDAVIATWLWHKWKVSLPMIRPGDRVIITGRTIKSGTGVYTPGVGTGESGAAKCFIHCRDARINIPFESFEAREELVGIQTSLMLAVHNDPSLFPCS